MEIKKRYNDEELEEFRGIINDRLKIAKSDYDETMKVLMNKNTNDIDDTSPTYKALAVQTNRKKNLCRWLSGSKSLFRLCKLHCCVSTTKHTA